MAVFWQNNHILLSAATMWPKVAMACTPLAAHLWNFLHNIQITKYLLNLPPDYILLALSLVFIFWVLSQYNLSWMFEKKTTQIINLKYLEKQMPVSQTINSV